MAESVIDDLGEPGASIRIDAIRAQYFEGRRQLVPVGRSNQHGRFVVQGLPPGEYLAVALEYLEEGQSADPEFLESMRPHATAFTLGEGEHKALDLKLTKIETGRDR